jgi:hypothetical protein
VLFTTRHPSAPEAITFPSRPRISKQPPRLRSRRELKLEEIARPRVVGLDVPDPGVLGVAGGDVYCVELWALAGHQRKPWLSSAYQYEYVHVHHFPSRIDQDRHDHPFVVVHKTHADTKALKRRNTAENQGTCVEVKDDDAPAHLQNSRSSEWCTWAP